MFAAIRLHLKRLRARWELARLLEPDGPMRTKIVMLMPLYEQTRPEDSEKIKETKRKHNDELFESIGYFRWRDRIHELREFLDSCP